MKWYTCLNAEALAPYGEDLRIAIASAIAIGRLEPHVVFDGDPAELYRAVGHARFTVHPRRSGLLADIERTEERPGWSRAAARGAFLRFEIGQVEVDDPFVLYTDIDVLFTRPVDLSHLAPSILAAAPGDNPHDWRDFCSGVMWLNVDALRTHYAGLMDVARGMLGTPNYDQDALNAYFRGRWDRLELRDHWKPYWGPDADARIVHFHGPKPRHARLMLTNDPAAEALPEVYRSLFAKSPEGYRRYVGLAELAARHAASAEGPATLAHEWPAPGARSKPRRRLREAIAEATLPFRSAPPDDSSLSDVAERASAVNFDEDSYLLLNADVAEAVRAGEFASGWSHFLLYGRAEGRLQYRPADPLATLADFEARAYLARNPDAARAIAEARCRDARAHFLACGRKERRRQARAYLRGRANGCVDDRPPSTANA